MSFPRSLLLQKYMESTSSANDVRWEEMHVLLEQLQKELESTLTSRQRNLVLGKQHAEVTREWNVLNVVKC